MLPSAVPGILAGVILAIGRIVGETAALSLYSGKRGSDSEKCDGIGAYIGGSYVSFVK